MRDARFLLAVVVTAFVLVATSCTSTSGGDNPDQPVSSTQPTQDAGRLTTPPATTAVDTVTPVRFMPREPGDVFALVELFAGGKGGGFGLSFDAPYPLPDGALAAVPDGRGGIVYLTGDQVWWIPEPSADPVLIEEPGTPVHMVGLRYVDSEPTVLGLIGDKLIGYRDGLGHLIYTFDEFSGEIRNLAVAGEVAVAIVSTDDGAAGVELVAMKTGDQRQLLAPVDAGEPGTPLAVAVAGDRVAVLRRSDPVLILTTDGDDVGSLSLGVDPESILSMDLAGNRLLVAFGEAATATDIVSGDREVVATPNGWVLGAVWADSYTPSQPPPVGDVTRFRVDIDKVNADVADPFLNVRLEPQASAELLAKLPPTYTGLRRTGDEETATDGGLWYEVELVDPVRITPGEPLHGGIPTGWVNSAFLVPLPEGLPVTSGEVPACVDNDPTITTPAGSDPPSYVYSLESGYLSERCLRIVLAFGTGAAPVSWDAIASDVGPADSLPVVREFMSGSSGFVIDLGGVDSVWPDATETADGVYVVRSGTTLQLWSTVPAGRATVHGLNDRGLVVVDVLVAADREIPSAAPGVLLTQEPQDGIGSVTVQGLARPFEGNLEITVTDGSGAAVEAVYSGSLRLGTTAAASYSVQTADWVEAWAPFAVRVDGLDSGDYTMILNAQGGRDAPEVLRVPFTVAETDLGGMPDWFAAFTGVPPLATSQEHEAAVSLVEFARGNGPFSSVPFADEVVLGLNTVEERTVARAQLANPEAWKADTQEFDGYAGDFSALATLARSEFVRLTEGPIPHCAGPPLQWSDTLEGLRQVNIEPIGGDSCLEWFGVSIFFNSSDEIAAVVLDLFGP